MSNPKSLAAIILIGFLIVGCQEREQTPEQQTTTRMELTHDIEILTIDGCQYIKATEGFGNSMSVSIIHKANCPNHTTETK